jgi:hypothetical protein
VARFSILTFSRQAARATRVLTYQIDPAFSRRVFGPAGGFGIWGLGIWDWGLGAGDLGRETRAPGGPDTFPPSAWPSVWLCRKMCRGCEATRGLGHRAARSGASQHAERPRVAQDGPSILSRGTFTPPRRTELVPFSSLRPSVPVLITASLCNLLLQTEQVPFYGHRAGPARFTRLVPNNPGLSPRRRERP